MPPAFSPQQQTAIGVGQGFYVLIAVPGSGKTTVITNRFKNLLANGVPSADILTLTFTKSAAEDMEGRAGLKKPRPGERKMFRTFHGYCLDFVKQHRLEFPFPLETFPLAMGHDQYKILGPIMRRLTHRLKYRDVLDFISQMKRRGISPNDAAAAWHGNCAEDYANAYRQYNTGLRAARVLDFDSMMIETANLLAARPELRARVAIKYLQTDESQDNDSTQWRLVQMLGKNVFCVGDPRQNMYSWRGAEPDGLTTKFHERFPGCKVLPLTKNYRSTKALVRYFNEINPMQIEGVGPMETDNEEGEPPTFRSYLSDEEEAKEIITNLKDPENSAVLARTNIQLQAFEAVCGELEIKYKLLGKSGFFSQPEVESVIAFAQYFVSPSDHCIKIIIRSPYDACRHIRRNETIDHLESMRSRTVGASSYRHHMARFQGNDQDQTNYVRQLYYQLEGLRNEIAGKTAENALRTILTRFNILNHYEDDEDAIDNNPAKNVRKLLKRSEKSSTLMEFVNNCLKAKQASRSTAKRLALSTVHSAKGKEWNHVFLAGVNMDVLPHKSSDLEEEKRIYFVGCTRAAKTLQVSCCETPSPFIKERVVRVDPGATAKIDYMTQMYELAQTKAAK